MAGTANRLGIIAFRMMMILATLRYFESSTGNANTIICEQIDFDNALRIVNKLEKHAIAVMNYLNGQPEKKELARLLHNQEKSYGDISEIVFGNKGPKGTIYKWLNNKNYNP